MKCRICGKERETSEFYMRGGGKRTDNRCKKCLAEILRNKRKIRLISGLCRDCGKVKDKRTGCYCSKCLEKCRAGEQRRTKANPEKYKQRNRDSQLRLKQRVFNAYGGCVCICCGEKHMEFLSIDHIKQDGATHRKEINGSARNGANLYRWLVRNNFPSGFRVLCMNCNFAIGHFGICPHGLHGLINNKQEYERTPLSLGRFV